MSDHEFEKKVQQKMDELRLRPSDAVWAEVDRNLRREKRRRRIVLWLPLMGILLTAGGYFIFTAPNKEGQESLAKTAPVTKTGAPDATATPSTSTAAASKPASGSVAKSNTATEPSSPVSLSTQKTNNPSTQNSTPSNNKPGSQSLQNENDKTAPVANKNISDKNISSGKKPPGGKNREPKTISTDKIITDKKPLQREVKDKEDAPKTTVDSNAIVNKDTDIDAGNKTALNNDVDSAAKAVTVLDSADKKSTVPAVVKNTPKKKQSSSSKWQWGVTANAGMANISEGSLFDVLKSVRVDDLTGNVPQYNGIPPVPDPQPSAISPGLTFTVGAFVQRNLSKRFSLSAGLQYSYFSVNTRVGRKVDSAVAVNYGVYYSQLASNVYRGADNTMHDYVNRYHFIELPVTVSYRLVRSKKFPLLLDAGLSFSHLLSTNSLHFDGISRVYYENDDFFKRMQLSLNGGLNLGIFQNSRHPLWIGPNLRYFSTGLIKKDVSASGGEQHIWSFGLNAKMLLKK